MKAEAKAEAEEAEEVRRLGGYWLIELISDSTDFVVWHRV